MPNAISNVAVGDMVQSHLMPEPDTVLSASQTLAITTGLHFIYPGDEFVHWVKVTNQ